LGRQGNRRPPVPAQKNQTNHYQFSKTIYSNVNKKICCLATCRTKKLHSNQNLTYFGLALILAALSPSEFVYVHSISEALVEFDDDSLKDFDDDSLKGALLTLCAGKWNQQHTDNHRALQAPAEP